eukprot:TRINITY_DN4561_c0_g1_i12.p1 TRINITY_DN4561_c0_g1~~TRINITY_DN4561_c0_g1_i12.p1  ORF type:complete len:961 (-),score=121.76 TRINITY_DN4561_c0_g1_i12:1398-4280(-)
MKKILIFLVTLIICCGKSIGDKIPYITLDQRPSVTHFTGTNDIEAARSALLDGADAIVLTVDSPEDLSVLCQYIELALSAEWERVVGLGIDLQSTELLVNVTDRLMAKGYSNGAPVFIISTNFDMLDNAPFIPVADLSELPIENTTSLVSELVTRGIKEVIASKDQIQRYDEVAQQLQYQTELYLLLKEAGISINLCCFNNDPEAPEFHGELINEIRHYLKLGGINALTRKPAVAFTVASEFILSSGPDLTFEFAVIAEVPFSLEQENSNGIMDIGWKSLVNELKLADLDFVVQLGNSQKLVQNCTKEFKEFILGEYEASIRPFFYSPGESEWIDCSSGSISTQDIQKRQELVKNLFASGNTSMGQVKLPVLRQSALPAIMPEFQKFQENLVWEQNNIVMVYPSISDVSVVPIDDAPVTLEEQGVAEKGSKELDVQSKAYADESPPNPPSEENVKAAIAWLEFAFNEASRRGSLGIVVFWHASLVFDYDSGASSVLTGVRERLAELTMRFGRPVLVFHTGSDKFLMDKPLISPNSGESMEMLTRIQCRSGQWMRVKVNPDAQSFNDVFTIKVEQVEREIVVAPTIKKSQEINSFIPTEDAFSVAVFGGLPNSRPLSTWNNLLTDISQAHVNFVVNLGDIKSPEMNCSDEYFQFILDAFNNVQHPLVYVPGDEEWAKCNSESAGAWNPHERLDFLRALFFDEPTMSRGKYPMPVTPQSKTVPEDIIEEIMAGDIEVGLPENVYWIKNNIVFATLHLVGSNNNLMKSDYDTQEVYEERLLEFKHRNTANLQFIDHVFDVANSEDAPGLVIFFNGNPFNQTSAQMNVSNIQIQTGFQDIMNLLRNETIEFGNPVVIVHSDNHQFLLDKPFDLVQEINMTDQGSHQQPIENLYRLVTPGRGQVWWVEIIIDPNHPDVFLFTPRLVRTNFIEHSPIIPVWAVDDPKKVCYVDEVEEEQYPGQVNI